MGEPRTVVVTGATGLIGKALCRELIKRQYRVIVLSRSPHAAQRSIIGAAAYLAWNVGEPGAWAAALDGAYGVVHLAGAPIAGKRWDTAYKQELLQSRVAGTRGLVAAIERCHLRPQVLVSSSGIDYYGDCGDTPVDERTPAGSKFLSQVCVAWEREALRAEALGVRTAVMRTGIVLDKHEGALAKLLLPFQFGVGGPILPGSQWWSWIHLDDLIGLMVLVLEDPRARGAFNATAPHPARNRDFTAALGRVLRRPAFFPIPGFALELLLGEMARPLLIEKQCALPNHALELGYQFAYPQLESALKATMK
jgi:uncharacterized protein (TIGR01777 family)